MTVFAIVCLAQCDKILHFTTFEPDTVNWILPKFMVFTYLPVRVFAFNWITFESTANGQDACKIPNLLLVHRFFPNRRTESARLPHGPCGVAGFEIRRLCISARRFACRSKGRSAIYDGSEVWKTTQPAFSRLWFQIRKSGLPKSLFYSVAKSVD